MHTTTNCANWAITAKKGKSTMNKNKYPVRCLHHFSYFTLQISLYIYVFPKVASNAGCLHFWLPMFIKNGLISRCAEKLQSTLESVGPVDAQQISVEVLKALPPTGLLQTSCQLKRIAIKRSKEVKMTSFSLPLATGCPRQQWEFMLEEEMLDTYLPLLLLTPSLNP